MPDKVGEFQRFGSGSGETEWVVTMARNTQLSFGIARVPVNAGIIQNLNVRFATLVRL